MLVYRVFPYLPDAAPGEPGHPLYEHRPQRGGRIDHPDYYVWYLSRLAEAACGETFGNLARWEESMFEFPMLPGARRALGVFELPDDLRILDLDDPAQLVRLGLRPTQIVTRNLAVTGAWGHRMWSETDPHAPGRSWQAVSWWSYHRPQWSVLASWSRPEMVRVEPLSLDHPAVIDSAKALYRTMT
ncbi:RES domain-containing protein [Speluncibacter jeojiensis]|uniref:RES domain-containing protein n=1 Tax=Speluncibacter jeojiensis TaxID=2710754 RepID=A0A9X4MB03_9ACTN|nr:RES domain-containing protein [Corynebacteriales bacterium D3-21]